LGNRKERPLHCTFVYVWPAKEKLARV
jgi:hypothetical protein